jgi:penicillin amidase
MRRALVIALALGVLAFTLSSMSCSRRTLRPIVSLPLTVDTLVAIPGLTDRASIVTDRWGIPHIEAANLHDLYLAWGYVTAHDRLWELEVSRRAASGRMWEWFGNATLRDDGGAQLLELAERGRRAWERDSLDANVRETVEAYAAGINAYIVRCHRGEVTWPDELATIAHEPEPWRPADTYLMLWAQGLLLDVDLPELDEAQQIAKSGYVAVERRRRFEMSVTYPTIPDSAAERLYGPRKPGMAARTDDEDDVAPPATRTLEDSPTTIAARVTPDVAARAERALGRWASFALPELRDHASNVFAVGPKRSASGKPMLANDPHLSLGVPSPLHLVHLRVPGVLDVAGATVPGLPSIVSGRSRTCAWGITALNADVSDVYADSLSADGKQVRWRGGWFTLRDEPYAMRFRLPGGVHIQALGQHRRYGPHGPVVSYDRKRHLALEMRWGPPDSLVTLRDLLGIERSTDARDVARRFSTLAVPCLNMVAADVHGHVVYQVAGAPPRRAVDPGLGAQPGDGRQEWAGWITGDSLPRWGRRPMASSSTATTFPSIPATGRRSCASTSRTIARCASPSGWGRSAHHARGSAQRPERRPRAGGRALSPRLLAATAGAATRLSPRAQAARDTLSAWDLSARRDRVAPTLYRAWYGAFLRRTGLRGPARPRLGGARRRGAQRRARAEGQGHGERRVRGRGRARHCARTAQRNTRTRPRDVGVGTRPPRTAHAPDAEVQARVRHRDGAGGRRQQLAVRRPLAAAVVDDVRPCARVPAPGRLSRPRSIVGRAAARQLRRPPLTARERSARALGQSPLRPVAAGSQGDRGGAGVGDAPRAEPLADPYEGLSGMPCPMTTTNTSATKTPTMIHARLAATNPPPVAPRARRSTKAGSPSNPAIAPKPVLATDVRISHGLIVFIAAPAMRSNAPAK